MYVATAVQDIQYLAGLGDGAKQRIVDTLRKTIIARAGRLTRPQGKLTLTLNVNPTVKNLLLRFLAA